jgi:hypothetical protein
MSVSIIATHCFAHIPSDLQMSLSPEMPSIESGTMDEKVNLLHKPPSLFHSNSEEQRYQQYLETWPDDNIRMVCHQQFAQYATLAMQVKELTDSMGRGSTATPQQLLDHARNDAPNIIPRLVRGQLGNKHYPMLPRGIFPWIDDLLQHTIDLLTERYQFLQQYFVILQPQLIAEKTFQETKRQKSDAIATKYPFKITFYLHEWMVHHAHEPYPSPSSVKMLALGTGLNESQIVNWATNVRKRSQKAVLEQRKKPRTYMEYVFLAAARDEPKSTIPPAISKKMPYTASVGSSPSLSTAYSVDQGDTKPAHVLTPPPCYSNPEHVSVENKSTETPFHQNDKHLATTSTPSIHHDIIDESFFTTPLLHDDFELVSFRPVKRKRTEDLVLDMPFFPLDSLDEARADLDSLAFFSEGEALFGRDVDEVLTSDGIDELLASL